MQNIDEIEPRAAPHAERRIVLRCPTNCCPVLTLRADGSATIEDDGGGRVALNAHALVALRRALNGTG